MSITFQHYGPLRGDACSCYHVRGFGNCTVEEFVKMVLAERPNEWGEFHFNERFGRCLDYQYGKADLQGCRVYKKYKDKRVVSVEADGGWSQMDYIVTCEE